MFERERPTTFIVMILLFFTDILCDHSKFLLGILKFNKKKMNKYCNLAFWLMGKWKLQISWIWLIVQRSRVILGLASTSKTYLAYVWPCNVRGYLIEVICHAFPKVTSNSKTAGRRAKGVESRHSGTHLGHMCPCSSQDHWRSLGAFVSN